MSWTLASDVPLPPRTSVKHIWPRPDEREHAQRTALDVPPPAGTPDLWISRSEALPEHWTVSPEQLVWAAGGRTWRRLASRGVWVNGCADGLGDDEHPGLLGMAGRTPDWRRLTHMNADDGDCAIVTYAVQTAMPEDLPHRTHFFWTSGVLLRDALARWPQIADRWHASGPGRTSRVIRDALGSAARFRVWLDYDEWVKEILE